ncbi:tRNA dihydrouridine synthase DusB [Candidatus Woesearchaeota archaeon]|nr:tRNA dihydrouridine synthase DusB [Candidatus Woesearchaeota archaeon]
MNLKQLISQNNIFLAPMAGVSDAAFRELCISYGAGLTFTEMISVEALMRDNNKTVGLMQKAQNEKVLVVQLFGSNVQTIEKAVNFVESKIVDFNFGCPVNKILKQGAGSALLEEPEKIKVIIKALKSSKKIVSAKIRLGLTKKSINCLENAKIIEIAGADMLVVHARTTDQGYSGEVYWSWIKKIKDIVKIPVVGNGDVVDGPSAKKMFETTGCDAIMIGRAAIGNPYLFKQITHYLKTGDLLPSQTPKQKINDFYKYLELAQKYGIKEFPILKNQAMYFSKGLPKATQLRSRILKTKNVSQVKKLFDDYCKTL